MAQKVIGTVNDAAPVGESHSCERSVPAGIRWPAGYAFVTAWLYPATTAERTAHVSLLSAWMTHLLAAIIVASEIVLFIAWYQVDGALDVMVTVRSLAGVAASILAEFQRHVVWTTATVAAVALAIEVGWLGLAMVATPWGARDEPLRESYHNALRQAWLGTARLVPAVTLVGTMTVVFEASYLWYSPEAVGSLMLSVLVLVAWFLWGVFRSVGVVRRAPAISRPPLCDRCGYNLTTIPWESRCPECGFAVIDSLGPGTRPGAPWEFRKQLGSWRAWCHCAREAVFATEQLGRQLQTSTVPTDYRRFFALHLPAIFAIGAACFVAVIAGDEGVREVLDMLTMVAIVGCAFGLTCILGAVAFMNVAAATIGVFESLRYRRNLLPGTIQVACYLTTYLAAWALFGGGSGVFIVLSDDAGWLRAIEEFTRVGRDALGMVFWFLPNLAQVEQPRGKNRSYGSVRAGGRRKS